jgi:hypothetical protein
MNSQSTESSAGKDEVLSKIQTTSKCTEANSATLPKMFNVRFVSSANNSLEMMS